MSASKRSDSRRMVSACAILLVGVLAWTGPASGQQGDLCRGALLFEPDAQLATITTLAIDIDDQITDGCWPNSEAARTAVELELRRYNFRIKGAESFLENRLILHGLGGSFAGRCVAALELSFLPVLSSDVSFSEAGGDGVPLRNVHHAEVWSSSGLYSGEKMHFPGRIKRFFEDTVQAFVLAHKKAQETVFAACPQMRERIARAREDTQ